jgi:hypothetical protein
VAVEFVLDLVQAFVERLEAVFKLARRCARSVMGVSSGSFRAGLVRPVTPSLARGWAPP